MICMYSEVLKYILQKWQKKTDIDWTSNFYLKFPLLEVANYIYKLLNSTINQHSFPRYSISSLFLCINLFLEFHKNKLLIGFPCEHINIIFTTQIF